MTQDKSELNKLIIQMLLQGAVADQPTFADKDINSNYNQGFGVAPPAPTNFAPNYQQPFRVRPPQIEKWWGLKS